MSKQKINLGLLPKLILAIIAGVLVGQISGLPEWIVKALITATTFFSGFLNFFIPFMIVGLVVKGIADLTEGAGHLLGVTVLVAYVSTIVAGSISYATSTFLFPKFITQEMQQTIAESGSGVTPYFEVPMEPFFDVTAAIIFAFMMGLGISWLKNQGQGEVIFKFFDEFQMIVMKVLQVVIVPLLPFYIFGNFVNLSYSGTVFTILSIFWRVFIVVLILHFLYMALLFVVAGVYTGKNPVKMIKHQITPYLTAVGTQSSAATIPVNVEAALKNGVSESIANFVVPLGATIHIAGSMITIIACSVAVLLMYGLPMSFGMMVSFIAVLAIAMVAAPGAPGGAIMSALPFLPMIGITSDAMQQLMISLYITQDSFGTAANVSGDNAIAVILDKIYYNKIKK